MYGAARLRKSDHAVKWGFFEKANEAACKIDEVYEKTKIVLFKRKKIPCRYRVGKGRSTIQDDS